MFKKTEIKLETLKKDILKYYYKLTDFEQDCLLIKTGGSF